MTLVYKSSVGYPLGLFRSRGTEAQIMKITLACIFVLGCFLPALSASIPEYAPVIETKNGKVVGIVREFDEAKIHLYQGIRYATAERFSKPKPVTPWSGIYNATTFQFACPQPAYHLSTKVDLSRGFETGSSSEDCLFLNVFKPVTATKKALPVMVWIHGGSFEFGTIFTVIYDGRVLASLGEVIVVTVNYRLGALGFLYGATEDAPGNQGLLDQIEALRWVQNHIEAFGGDPKQVTVFGESAGSMSVGSLVLSPLARGLFHRAITQSGAPNSYLGSEDKKLSYVKTQSLAEKLKCNATENAKEILKCLRTASVESILHQSKDSIANGEAFIPIWGEEVMPIRPVEALKTGKVNEVDLMFGVTRNEGSAFVAKILPLLNPDTTGADLHIAQVKTMLKIMFMMFNEPHIEEVVDFYSRNLNESDKTQLRLAVSDAFGDYHLVCPTVLFGEQFAKVTPHKTHYSYRVSRPTSIPIMGCRGWMGVCHGEDVVYVFGIPARIRGLIFSEEEYRLSVDMIKAWTNFAKGNSGKVGGVEWTEALSNGTVNHMNLDSTDYRMVPAFYREKCDVFWKPKIFV